MDFVRLGRTNETVSVVGLGCGGHSRLGMARGATTEQAADIVLGPPLPAEAQTKLKAIFGDVTSISGN
jgi:hypothetical protein